MCIDIIFIYLNWIRIIHPIPIPHHKVNSSFFLFHVGNSLLWQWETWHPLSFISWKHILSTCIYLINLPVGNQSPNTATPWNRCSALRLWYPSLGHPYFHIWTPSLLCYMCYSDTPCWVTVLTGRRAEMFYSCLHPYSKHLEQCL